MIASPLSRRVVLGGIVGAAGAAGLSGCSISDFTERRVVDPQAADRERVTRACELSEQLLADLGPMGGTSSTWAGPVRALHTEQIAVFIRSAGLKPSPSASASPAASAFLTRGAAPAREQALSQELRSLALAAESGDVAMLLASAAAGIDQLLAKGI